MLEELPLIDKTTSPLVSPEEPLLFEKSSSGRVGYSLPPCPVPEISPADVISEELCRSELGDFPEISENEVVRHFVRLSQKNYCIDTGFYPLGSCTMKYNPKINEEVASLGALAKAHPLWPEKFLQPALSIQFQLQSLLSSLTGLEAFTLQPNAGAHGELVGLKIMRAYHDKKAASGGPKKTKVIVPDSAHGTNPATCTMVGYEIISVPTGPEGIVEVEEIKKIISPEIAGIMMTNPNTCGLFEKNIHEIAKLIHAVDGLFYMDGANFNAIVGITRPADLGVDIMHINLHKTFSTPHGGGGPGSGPVGVRAHLQDFLPSPTVVKTETSYKYNYEVPSSIGRLTGYYGNFSILIRALAYMLSLGTTPAGNETYAKKMATAAVLNANYIRHRLRSYFKIPYDSLCMHEVILSDEIQEKYGIKTLNIAKRLMDYGYHPMTVYFPLIIHGAMMIEPTESETKETLDRFCDVMIAIAKECETHPEIVLNAPTRVARERVDELRAQKQPRLRWSREA
jgi:glycine dehydrogenase subunit 2